MRNETNPSNQTGYRFMVFPLGEMNRFIYTPQVHQNKQMSDAIKTGVSKIPFTGLFNSLASLK